MISIILLILSFNPLFSNKITFSEHTNNLGYKKAKQKLLEDRNYRNGMQKFIDSEDGRFRLHYDTTGVDAINLVDNNNNSIPDYLDSAIIYLKKSYQVEVIELGWNAPLSDEFTLNGDNNGGSGAIDVYFAELADDGYGFADNVAIKNQNGQSGYLILDNNYTDKIFKSKEFEALKVTIAHELHHVIQFSYTSNLPWPIVLEMLSTYMENKVFPETLDMKNYVDSLFRTPTASQLSVGDYTYGYMYNIFFHYSDLKYGQESVHKLWESLIGKTEHFLKVWDKVFSENYNSNITAEFTEFVEWCYYSGDRAIEGQYFPFAKSFTTLRPSLNAKFSEPSISDSKNLFPFGFNFLRVEYPNYSPAETNDTVDVLITNTSMEKLSDDPKTDTYFYATFSSQQPQSEKFNSIDYYYLAKDKSIFDYNIIEYPGFKPTTISSPYPSPFIISKDNYLIFPVEDSQKTYDEVELQLLTSNMESFYSAKHKIEIVNNKKVVKLDDTQKISSSGIYYYIISNEDGKLFGKFAVRK